MRYDAEWLMECLLLRIKSPRAYKHLLKSSLLPLPSLESMRRLLSSCPCSFGLNDEALQSIKKTFELFALDLRRGSLVWDEMSITKSVKYDAQKMRFDGFVDYGTGDICAEPGPNGEQQLADHCLVFIFRPYRSSWVQPIAVYATKGAAPGHIISRLLMKAIVALEAVGARVTSVTCDGAQTNKSVWAECGVSGSPDEQGLISCSMEHPTATEPEERIWFLQDVPHLFKCVRNHIFTRRKLARPRRKKTAKSSDASAKAMGQQRDDAQEQVRQYVEERIQVYNVMYLQKTSCLIFLPYFQFKGQEIRHADYALLFEVDSPQQGGMGIAFRLRHEHIYPSNFAKMNVKLMTQARIVEYRLCLYINLIYMNFYRFFLILLQNLSSFIG